MGGLCGHGWVVWMNTDGWFRAHRRWTHGWDTHEHFNGCIDSQIKRKNVCMDEFNV